MVMKQLKSVFRLSKVLFFVWPFTAVLAVFSPYWLFLLLCMPALYLLMAYLYGSMFKRLNHIAIELLDPELLENESQVYYTVLRGPNMMNVYYIFESLRLDLRGEYASACECYTRIDSKQPNLAESLKWSSAYYDLRAGNLQLAQNLILELAQAAPAKTNDLAASRLHTLGLYHLEKGDFKEAEDQLLSSLKLSNMAAVRLNCSFDLACLYEKESQTEKASGLYRQAAAIGPKTWMGQEAARRGASCL